MGAVARRHMLPREITFSSVKAPVVPYSMKRAAMECVARFVDLANRQLKAQMAMPTCSFDLRGAEAGKTWQSRVVDGKRIPAWHVQFNAVLLRENLATFLSDIVPHEVAHLAAAALHRGEHIEPHGTEWQAVMRAFGVVPTPRHSMTVANARATKLYRFRCACRTTDLTSRLAHSALHGLRSCRKCKQKLEYDGWEKLPQQPWRQVPLRRLLASGFAPPGHQVRPALEQPALRPGVVLPSVPSASTIQFVASLAKRLSWQVPPAALTDQSDASAFIDRAKAALAKRAASAPQPVSLPSERQLSYAKSIAQQRGISIPAKAMDSRLALSRWISVHQAPQDALPPS